jgi:NADP-dependent 3-hydroxy acid dehydrogenase YdfG
MSEIALITGCSGSLGAAVAQRLATSGYRLVMTGRDEEKLNANPMADALKVSADLSLPCCRSR